MTSKIVQDLNTYVKSVVDNHSNMAILLHTCEGCCEVHSCNFMIPASLFYEVNDPLLQVCYKP